MPDSCFLYLMISRTDSGMGRLIRRFTRYSYNHVSLTLDPTFRSWVSFARYYHNMPLYGGFVTESAERFLADGGDARVRLFRLELSREEHDRLARIFALAGSPDSGMIYNSFDALASLPGWHLRIPNAYTCLSFADAVLGLRFRHIRELDDYFSDRLIYAGKLADLVPDSGSRTDPYFTRLGRLRGSWLTVCHFGRLSARIFRWTRRRDMFSS